MDKRDSRALLTPRRIDIRSSVISEISEHALESVPAESCGLVGAGDDGVISRCYRTRNDEDSKAAVRYFMNPADQFAAMRSAEGDGLEIVGAYHSHVQSPAYPSPTDIGLAQYPEWIWLIVSLAEDPPEVRAFEIAGETVTEIELVEVAR